jgi:hypothetical protein
VFLVKARGLWWWQWAHNPNINLNLLMVIRDVPSLIIALDAGVILMFPTEGLMVFDLASCSCCLS